MTTALYFILIIASMMVVHELGHFVTAKRAGVKVFEFGIGFPPRLFAIKRGETEYSLNLLPIGAFVKMAGEEDPSEERSLAAKPMRTRFVVLAAGSAMNALLAVVLFSSAYMVPRDTLMGQVIIESVIPNSPADQAGLQSGDIVRQVNDRPVYNTGDLSSFIHLNMGAQTTIIARRGRSELTVKVVPRYNYPADQGPTGIVIGMSPNTTLVRQSKPVWEAIPLGFRNAMDTITITKNELVSSFVRGIAPQVAGPIGIYQMTYEVQKTDLLYLLDFAALLNISVAVFNMLPFPMLDGGRLVFVLIEWVRRGKRIPPEKEGLVHLVGLAVLLSLMFVISYYDITRILSS
ncbi:MAG: RIP metalloprotease [Chloroflexota bacterium]|nr:MAG: RIP metalloprotease [Chloroflexota bacterium]